MNILTYFSATISCIYRFTVLYSISFQFYFYLRNILNISNAVEMVFLQSVDSRIEMSRSKLSLGDNVQMKYPLATYGIQQTNFRFGIVNPTFVHS